MSEFELALVLSVGLHTLALSIPNGTPPERSLASSLAPTLQVSLPGTKAARPAVTGRRGAPLLGGQVARPGAVDPTGEPAPPPTTAATGLPLDPAQFRRPSELSAPPGLHTLGALEASDLDPPEACGRVLIEVFIDEDGRPAAATVLENTAPAGFRDRVIELFGSARYTPGELFGHPVKSRLKIESTLCGAAAW